MSEIRKDQIAEKDVLKNLIPTKQQIDLLNAMNRELKEAAKLAKSDLGGSVGNINDIKKQQQAQEQLNKITKQKSTIDKERIKLEQRLKKEQAAVTLATSKEAKELAKLRAEKNAINKATRDEIKQTERAKNAYSKLVDETRDYKNESKRLGAELLALERAGKKNTTQYKNLSRDYSDVTAKARRYDSQLKKLDKTVGDNFRNVGNYSQATRKLTSALGSLGIAVGVGAVFRNLGRTVSNYNQAVTDLAAISGKTAEELKPLNDQARQLGATTQFSASEVTGLQIELAKLGFTTQEITDSTGGIANFAAATGVEIPRAAALAGSALRAFNLDATEIDRVVSTLGVATTKTALDFSKLENGLSTVAPVAASFGFSIEDTTALLGQLSNAGFDASSSATATRNILLNLADANGSLAKELGRPVKNAEDLAAGLQELQSRGIDLAEALELTDKRSVAAFSTFIQGSDSLVDLRDSITDVNDELTDMADKRLQSVGGAVKLLESAWEGFVLDLNESIGASDAFNTVIRFVADNLGTIFKIVGSVATAFLSYKGSLIATRLATVAYAVATKGLATAQALFTGNLKRATAGMRVFNAVTKMNPIGLLVSAVTTAITVFSIFTDKTKEQTEAEKKRSEQLEEEKRLQEDMNNQLSAATSQFVSLIEQLKQTNKDSKERETLIKRINSQYGTTLQNIQDETKFIKQLNVAVDEYIKGKKQQILISQNETRIGKLLKEQIEIEEDLASASIDRTRAAEAAGRTLLNRQRSLLNSGRITKKQYDENTKAIKENIAAEGDAIVQQGIKELGYTKEIARLDEIKRLIRLLAGENIELGDSSKEAADGINDLGGASGEAEKNLKKQLLTLQDIDALLRKGRYSDPEMIRTQKEIEDEEISQENERIQRQLDQRLTIINDMERSGTLSTEEAADQRLIAEIEALQARRKVLIQYGKDTVKIDKEISQAQLELSNRTNKQIAAAIEERKRKEEESKKDMLELTREIQQQITDTIENNINKRIELQQKEANAAQKQADFLRGLAENGNIEAEESIKAELEREREAIKEQQRLEQQKRALQLVSSGLNTFNQQIEQGAGPGEALAKTIATSKALVDFLSNLSFFAEGTDYAPQGKAIVDEEGAEIITDKMGKIKEIGSNSGARMVDLNRGDKVITAPETQSILNQLGAPSNFAGNKIDRAGSSYDLKMLKELQKMREDIRNTPQSNVGYDKALGEVVSEFKGRGQRRINRYRN